MKIAKNYFVICENVLTDDKGRISLINIYDVIYSRGFPAVHSSGFKVAANFDVVGVDKKLEQPVKFSLSDPDGQTVVESAAHISLPASKKQKRGILLGGSPIALTKAGTYVARLELVGVEAFEQELFVKQIEKGEE